MGDLWDKQFPQFQKEVYSVPYTGRYGFQVEYDREGSLMDDLMKVSPKSIRKEADNARQLEDEGNQLHNCYLVPKLFPVT